MDFKYTEVQESTRKMVREFADRELAPGAAERDRDARFDPNLYKRLGELGICGMRFPEEFGGSNTDFLSWCLALEEIGRVDLSLSWTLFVGIGGALRAVRSGEEQGQRWKDSVIIPTVRGEALCAAGITEPGAGSDTSAIQTAAVEQNGEWVINGTKVLSTNAGSELCCAATVVCLTDREKKEFTTIMVPTGTTGFSTSAPYRKMGLKSSYTGELVFEDCRVPLSYAVSEKGQGRKKTVEYLAEGRIQLSSTAIGLHQACADESLKYAKERVAFKRSISQFQHVQAMLVEIALNLELSRLLRDKAATMVDDGERVMQHASMVKWFACESAIKASKDALQVFGGIGFLDETPVSRYYRDIRAATLADGATEIQKWIIARELGC